MAEKEKAICDACDKELYASGEQWHFLRIDKRIFIFCKKCYKKLEKFVEDLK